QTERIQSEARGEKTEVSVLLIHAQDHSMNAITVKELAAEFIDLYKKLEAKGEESMTGIKIATIGGGSSYTPELIEGVIKRYDELPVRAIWLVDTEAGKEKLEIVGNLENRMVKKSGLPIEVHLTLDRREAL
ncbi:hypothetical protein FO584_33655, partial [Bacillus thuringiensis]|nr:hypothetical protein [Bacillus thuringiensis]